VRLEDLGLTGNGQFSALVERTGAIVWCCLPRFDSEPVFATLLDQDGGSFLVGPADGGIGAQRYVENTNVLETTFRTDGGSFRVVDFAPRFVQHARVFRPTQRLRIVEPLEGTPQRLLPSGESHGLAKDPRGSRHRHRTSLLRGPLLS
jgi:Domain of unknown function (DUF5911)